MRDRQRILMAAKAHAAAVAHKAETLEEKNERLRKRQKLTTVSFVGSFFEMAAEADPGDAAADHAPDPSLALIETAEALRTDFIDNSVFCECS